MQGMTPSLTDAQRDACTAAGLSAAEVHALIALLTRDLAAVRAAMVACCAPDVEGSRCVTRVEVSASDDGALTLLVLDAWWTTTTGADDLLEIGWDLTWRTREHAARVEWFATVSDHGSIAPMTSWTTHYGVEADAVAAVRPCAGRLREAFEPSARVLAAAVARLRRNHGAWA
jgi:hypothetical protein